MEYNVKDFGAVGDGVTDDTAAIQKAFDTVGKAGGGIIRIPGKTYKITGMLRIMYSNITVIGELGNKLEYHGVGAPLVEGRIDLDTTGEQFNGKETGLFLLIMGSSSMPDMIHDIVIKNVNFDGTHQEFKGGSEKEDLKLTSTKPYYHSGMTGIRPQCVYFLKIEGCKLIDIYGNGIAVDRCSHVEIVDNYLEDCSGNGFGHGMAGDCFGDGIGCWKSSHCYVARNFVYNKRTFLTHEISCNRDVYGYPCGRSGLEFEYPANIDVWGNPEHWTPLHLNAEIDPTSYNLTFEQNVVYGYTKGCHLENGVNCRILNNTFVYNHIGFLDATGGNTIVKGNYFDPAGINPSVQGGYDWYWRCGCAFTHFLGQWFDNAIIDGNVFVGDQTGVQIGRNKVTIQNNIFRQTGGNCIGSRIGWASEITIQNNEFSSPDWKSCPGQFIGLSGVNIHVNNNTFEVHEGLLGKLAISCGAGSQFCNNTLRNVEMGVSADLVEGNSLYVVAPEDTRYIDIGTGRVVKNNSYWIYGAVSIIHNPHILKDNIYYYEDTKGYSPTVGIGDYSLKYKCEISGNVVETKEPMTNFWINVDGRIPTNLNLNILVENNRVTNYDKNFKLFHIWNNGKDYKTANIVYRNNFPNTIKLNNTVNSPLNGCYYNIGDKIEQVLTDDTLICTKEGFYSAYEWNAKNKYKYNEFVVHEGTVYKCITKEKELQSEVKPSRDTVNWQSFGEVAEFKNE